MDPTIIAVVGALIASSTSLLLTALNGRIASRNRQEESAQKRQDKIDEYDRQDLVATRVDAAALKIASATEAQTEKTLALLKSAQAITTLRSDKLAHEAAMSRERIASQLTTIDDTGNKIHILVNSEMTAARTRERDSLRLLLISLRQIQKLNSKLGIVNSIEMFEEIERTENKIETLDQILAERHAAQLTIDQEPK